MKKILLIATGGTIASKYTSEGLCPQISSEELLSYVPTARDFCEIDAVQPFNLDSTNINASQWLALASLIQKKYEYYDGFVICHGTDTMAYTAAALSYLIQNNRKPVVITGAQKPIDLPITDARANLLDSLRFAAHDRAHGVNIVFGGEVIAGTRAKKERSKSFNAFSSINFPQIAIIQDSRIIFYIYTYALQDLPSWLTGTYGAREDVMAPLAAYAQTASVSARDVIRLIVRLTVLIYINLFPDPQTMAQLVDQLTPLMVLSYPVACMIGYLRAPAVYAKRQSMQRRAKKAAVRKAQKKSMVSELLGSGGDVHYGQRPQQEEHKKKELI